MATSKANKYDMRHAGRWIRHFFSKREHHLLLFWLCAMVCINVLIPVFLCLLFVNLSYLRKENGNTDFGFAFINIYPRLLNKQIKRSKKSVKFLGRISCNFRRSIFTRISRETFTTLHVTTTLLHSSFWLLNSFADFSSRF